MRPGKAKKLIDKQGEEIKSKAKEKSVQEKTFVRRRERTDFRDGIKEKEAYKGVRGMPWLSETTKDVVSCEKLRGAANER